MSKEDSNSRNSPKSIRSFLFVPGNHPDKIRKVFGYGADAVILDLEDACADRDKPAARESVVQALKAGQGSLGYIRINAFDASYGTESCSMSFIVNRPANEPGFYLDRTDGAGRTIIYSVKSYSVMANAEGSRY